MSQNPTKFCLRLKHSEHMHMLCKQGSVSAPKRYSQVRYEGAEAPKKPQKPCRLATKTINNRNFI